MKMCYNKAVRTWFTVFILIIFSCSAFAEEVYVKKIGGYPQGTFKKARNGKIIQYDKNGKKIGVYKLNSRKIVK